MIRHLSARWGRGGQPCPPGPSAALGFGLPVSAAPGVCPQAQGCVRYALQALRSQEASSGCGSRSLTQGLGSAPPSSTPSRPLPLAPALLQLGLCPGSGSSASPSCPLWFEVRVQEALGLWEWKWRWVVVFLLKGSRGTSGPWSCLAWRRPYIPGICQKIDPKGHCCTSLSRD